MCAITQVSAHWCTHQAVPGPIPICGPRGGTGAPVPWSYGGQLSLAEVRSRDSAKLPWAEGLALPPSYTHNLAYCARTSGPFLMTGALPVNHAPCQHPVPTLPSELGHSSEVKSPTADTGAALTPAVVSWRRHWGGARAPQEWPRHILSLFTQQPLTGHPSCADTAQTPRSAGEREVLSASLPKRCTGQSQGRQAPHLGPWARGGWALWGLHCTAWPPPSWSRGGTRLAWSVGVQPPSPSLWSLLGP